MSMLTDHARDRLTEIEVGVNTILEVTNASDDPERLHSTISMLGETVFDLITVIRIMGGDDDTLNMAIRTLASDD